MNVFSRAYEARTDRNRFGEATGFCPIEAGSVGYQGEPLVKRRSSLHNLLADNECAHGCLPIDGVSVCGCWR